MEIGDRAGKASSYGHLGMVFETLGEYVKAKEYQEKTLAITMEIGDRDGQAKCRGQLGFLFFHFSVNMSWLKNVGKKHLRSTWKLVTEKEKQ